jgi:hypothetical protein
VLVRNRYTPYFYRYKNDLEWRAFVVGGEQRRVGTDDLQPQLLPKLPNGRIVERFPNFKLAPRKLPEPPVSLVRWALRDEDEFLVSHHGCQYEVASGHGCSGRGREF